MICRIWRNPAGRRWATVNWWPKTAWPKYDPHLTQSDSVTIAIQVNGKRRGEISLTKDADSKTVEAAALGRMTA